jgi:hypothetical protein
LHQLDCGLPIHASSVADRVPNTMLPCQLDTLLLPADICSLVVQPGK